ncbi:hypothetical protein AGRI_15480 [Alishewanella agri BL06]|uniref:Uncharacterized protein n=1 Tax=Alishewanella agri BL06 TaxID=1195246 RepID=I8U7G0_9ALTE|nr:hypothetical protein AGRI_15480 [Alishewanella agri BL06]
MPDSDYQILQHSPYQTPNYINHFDAPDQFSYYLISLFLREKALAGKVLAKKRAAEAAQLSVT